MSAALVPVENEGRSTKTRITKGGRRLTYMMTVIQQPKQARACGQGAKSSTDRRPVDPPPMVDLRILEGEEGNQHDITFAYDANFQLYVTLEHARVISQGRVPPSTSANQLALAGQTVTGMNYLERPQPGGYFIYSDLSVRHEGKYRLSFQLYEETKNPMDADANDTNPPPDPSVGIGKFLTGRSEVKSAPFIVYSAKKFPGLMESTQLSRTIADQGCRVRIRRDVRMRRRDQLSSMKDENWEEYEDETAEQRAERNDRPDSAPTPPVVSEIYPRQRSHSIASLPAQTQPQSRPQSQPQPQLQPQSHSQPHPPSQVQQPQSRTSSQDLNQQYVNSYMPPPPPTTQQQQQQLHQQQYAPSAYTPQSSYENTPISPYPPPNPYMTHHSQYPHAQYPFQTPGMPQIPPPPPPQHQHQYMPLQSPTYEQQYTQNMYHHQQQQQQQPVPHNYGYPPYNSGHPMSQMGPNTHGMYGPIMQPPHLTQQSMYTAPNHQAHPPPPPPPPPSTLAMPLENGTALAPLKPVDPSQPKPEIPSPSLLGLTNMSRHAPPQFNEYQQCAPMPQPPPQYLNNNNATAKRSFGSVFDTQHVMSALRGGARPALELQTTAGVQANDDGSDEDFDLEQLKMRYRRADGTEISRSWPLRK